MSILVGPSPVIHTQKKQQNKWQAKAKQCENQKGNRQIYITHEQKHQRCTPMVGSFFYKSKLETKVVKKNKKPKVQMESEKKTTFP